MAMQDPYNGTPPGMSGPYVAAFGITPDDVAPIASVPRAIYIGQAGDLTVAMRAGGPPITFKNLPQGREFRIRVTHVFQTGTTATDLVGLY